MGTEGGRSPKVCKHRRGVIVARKWRKAQKNSIKENKRSKLMRELGSKKEGRSRY